MPRARPLRGHENVWVGLGGLQEVKVVLRADWAAHRASKVALVSGGGRSVRPTQPTIAAYAGRGDVYHMSLSTAHDSVRAIVRRWWGGDIASWCVRRVTLCACRCA